MREVNADDRRIQRWLDVLRDGSEMEKIGARRALAGVFEQRGMFDEAIELLERNVEAGVRSADTLRWLSRLYQTQGDEATSLEAAVDASRLLAPPTAEIASPLGVDGRQPRTLAPRDLTTYLVLTVGFGSMVGVVVWLLAPLLRA
jgi:hypothetical protein